jgi:hypothetical protein
MAFPVAINRRMRNQCDMIERVTSLRRRWWRSVSCNGRR